jgi:putative ABC transport system ATP-binding protein
VTPARVQVSGVRRSFGPEDPVLRDVSFTLEPGGFTVLSGPSGSGKSTLLQIIGGLDRPDAGTVDIDGERVTEQAHPIQLRRHVVGFVFQLHHLLPALTAQGNVELPLMAAHVPRSERESRAREALSLVGVGSKARFLPAELSGGERQRVALARGIVHRPRLILADEPTAGLDRVSAEHVAAVLAGLAGPEGATVLAVSHDPALIERADRTLVLADGVVREEPQAVERAAC